MVTLPSDDHATPLVDDGSNRLLLEVARTIRDNLHTLFGLSLVFLAVALPWVVLATLTSWAIAWAPLVLTTAPVWATIVAVADRLLVGEAVGWRVIVGDGRRLAVPAMVNGTLPAICGTVLLVLTGGARESWWAETAVLAAAGMGIGLLLLAIPAGPMVIRHNLSGLALWEVSAAIVVKRPAQVLGTVALAGTGLWLAMAFGPAALLGTAPFGVLVSAITQPDPETPEKPGRHGATHPVPALDTMNTGRGTE